MGFANKLGGFFGGMALGAIDSANKHMPMMFQHNLRKQEREEGRRYQEERTRKDRIYQEGITGERYAREDTIRAETRGYEMGKRFNERVGNLTANLSRIERTLNTPLKDLGADHQKQLREDLAGGYGEIAHLRAMSLSTEQSNKVEELSARLKPLQQSMGDHNEKVTAYKITRESLSGTAVAMSKAAAASVSGFTPPPELAQRHHDDLLALGYSAANAKQLQKQFVRDYKQRVGDELTEKILTAGSRSAALGLLSLYRDGGDVNGADKLESRIELKFSSKEGDQAINTLADGGTVRAIRKELDENDALLPAQRQALEVSLAAKIKLQNDNRNARVWTAARSSYNTDLRAWKTDPDKVDKPTFEEHVRDAADQWELMTDSISPTAGGVSQSNVLNSIKRSFRNLLQMGVDPQKTITEELGRAHLTPEAMRMVVNELANTFPDNFDKVAFESREIETGGPSDYGDTPYGLQPYPQNVIKSRERRRWVTEPVGPGYREYDPEDQDAYIGAGGLLDEAGASYIMDEDERLAEMQQRKADMAGSSRRQAQGGRKRNRAIAAAKDRYRQYVENRGPALPPADPYSGDPHISGPEAFGIDPYGDLFGTRPTSEATYVDEERAGEQVQNGEEEVAEGVGGRGPGKEEEYDEYIARGLSAAEEEHKESLDFNLVDAVILAESGGGHFDPKTKTGVKTSGKDAVGYMQLRKAAAEEAGVDRFDPEDNVKGGIDYLVRMKQKARKDHGLEDLELDIAMLMMFNWGPGNFKKWWSGKKTIPRETRNYVTKILGEFHDIRKVAKARKTNGESITTLREGTDTTTTAKGKRIRGRTITI